jgi:hypothetical protein
MMELALLGNSGKARHLLLPYDGADAPELVRKVRAEAAWRVGELLEARQLYASLQDETGLALVDWALGDASSVDRLSGDADYTPPDWRGYLLRELNALTNFPGWHQFKTDAALILSDMDGHWRSRGVSEMTSFQGAVIRYLRSEGVVAIRPIPQAIVGLCAKNEVFATWNKRFGGARFQEADGIYRQGQRTLFVQEDMDEQITRSLLHHELVHHILYHQALALPRMIEEGLAELLAHAPMAGTELRIQEAIAPGRLRDCMAILNRGTMQEPAQYILADEPFKRGLAQDAYAMSWAILHYMTQRKGALGELIRSAATGEDAVASLLPQKEELIAHVMALSKRE